MLVYSNNGDNNKERSVSGWTLNKAGNEQG